MSGAGAGVGGTGSGRIPLILDVDTGIDDSLALLYTAASPEVELIAVTALSGNVEVADTERNTRAVLELAGLGHVPVYAGPAVPLSRPLEITPETHGPRGIGHAELPEPAAARGDRNAVDVIVEAARQRPGEITLVTLGPLTTLEAALRAEPRLPWLLRRWIMMGGAFTVPGNTTPVCEWNIHCDPEAAAVCFDAWSAAVSVPEGVGDGPARRMLAMGLDVTEKARILPEHLERLWARAGATPATNGVLRFIDDALRFYFEFHAKYDGFYGAFIHDPLVTAVAIDGAEASSMIGDIRPWFVAVDACGGPGDGQTIADRRGTTGKLPNADVVMAGDPDEFLRRLIERVGGLAAARG